MHFDKIHNKGQARLFQSQYLEIFTKTHPLVIWGIYLPVIVGLLYYSGYTLAFNTVRIILTFIGGMIFWTLFEYVMHRFAWPGSLSKQEGREVPPGYGHNCSF